MSMFEVGDVVVCVRKPKSIHLNTPSAGDVLRVTMVAILTRKARWWGVKKALCLGFAGKGSNGWEAHYFRKITAADEQFTARIKACRPAHRKTPVSA